jgi:hypothetical protein
VEAVTTVATQMAANNSRRRRFTRPCSHPTPRS